MVGGAGGWHFHEPHLTNAVEEWQRRDSPSHEALGAFYGWAAEVAAEGPPSVMTMATTEPDEFVSLIPEVRVFVTYLAIAQDHRIFVRRIEPA